MYTSFHKALSFKVGITSIAKLILFTGVSVNEFYNDLKIELVKQTQLKGSKTALKIAIQTGIDRRQVSLLLHGEQSLYVKPNKLYLIIKELFYYKAINNKKQLTQKKFNSICTKCSNGTFTHNSILVELKNAGIIKQQGNKLLISNHIDQSILNHNEISINQQYLLESLVSNITNSSNQGHYLCKTNYTTKISPSKVSQVQEEIAIKMKTFQADVKNIIQKNEAKVAENTFPKYGLNIFDFTM